MGLGGPSHAGTMKGLSGRYWGKRRYHHNQRYHQYLSQTNPSWRAKNIRILEKQPAGVNPTVVQTQVGER